MNEYYLLDELPTTTWSLSVIIVIYQKIIAKGHCVNVIDISAHSIVLGNFYWVCMLHLLDPIAINFLRKPQKT